MAGKYFTEEDIRKMMTEKVKDYLDKGWIFNFNYMRVSNGYEFAAVTDGKDTVVIYFQFDKIGRTSSLNVEKFTGHNNEYNNIWLESGRGEILETTQFIYKYETKTYVVVNGYDEDKCLEKRHERRANRNNFESNDISDKMKETMVNFIKSKGIPGLKRFKVSDVEYGYYKPRMKKYVLRIKGNIVEVHRDGWNVKVI